MSSTASTLNPDLAALAEFAGMPLKLATHRMTTLGFVGIALGTTVTSGWWNGTQYTTHVLQTDDPTFVETMAMNWLMSDQKTSRFVGIVMNGNIRVEGNRHDALILRSRTADSSMRMMAYQPYYAQSGVNGPVQSTIIDFPAEQGVAPDARDAALAIMLGTMFGKTN